MSDGDAATARRRLALGAVLLVALGLRLGWAVFVDETDPRAEYRYDASFYDGAARQLAQSGRYLDATGAPTARFPPGYPALLGAAYAIFGDHLLAAKLLNVLLGTVTVFFVFAIGTLAYGSRVGLLAAAFLAVWPGDVFYTGLTMSEVGFGCHFTGCVLAFLAWSDDPARAGPRWLGFGALVGLAALTRGLAVLWLGVPFLVWLATLGLGRVSLLRMGLATAGFALALAPWAARNQLVMGGLVPISTGGSYTLLAAHSPPANGTVPRRLNDFQEQHFAHLGDGPSGEVAIYRAELRYALGYMLSHPGKELRLIPIRLYNLYRPVRDALTWAADSWFAVMLVLALAGSVRAFAPSTGPAFAVPLTFLYLNVLIAVLFYGEPRYHANLVPFMAILAALAVDGRRRPWRLSGPPAERSEWNA